MSALVKSVRLRLNPFEIRGGLKPHYRLLGEYARHRLNPFEIRGGLKLKMYSQENLKFCLNPFEIRGGLKRELDINTSAAWES